MSIITFIIGLAIGLITERAVSLHQTRKRYARYQQELHEDRMTGTPIWAELNREWPWITDEELNSADAKKTNQASQQEDGTSLRD